MNLNVFLITNRFTNILQVKKYLIGQKKKGIIFFPGTMANLSPNEEFDLFFCIEKPSTTKKYAFPISASMFHKKLPITFLIEVYKNYYDTEEIPKHSFFHNLSIYKGTDWYWYYQDPKREFDKIQNG